MRNIYRSLMRNVGHTQWFSDLGKDLVPLDRAVQRVSGGKLSLVGENTVTQLLLTTTGRKTGRSRTTPLLYAPDGDAFVVVGSNWGGRIRIQHGHSI
ncbi:nitroreductase/quinone reductase family protein [Rhodococcus sp. 2.95]